MVQDDLALVGVAVYGDFLEDLGAFADDLDFADVLAVGLVDRQMDRDLVGLVGVLDGRDVAQLVEGAVGFQLIVDLQILVLGGVDAASVQRAVEADLGEVVGQDDVAAGVGVAPVALVVVLVVGGGHVPAHGQAEVILLVGGEVGGAAHLALAVADLNEVQHVVALRGIARVVVEVAEGGAGVVELGHHRNGVAAGVEGNVLGGVDAGDLRAAAGGLGFLAVDVQALVGVGHQVVVQMHAGVAGLVVEVLVVAGDRAVGVEGVGVAGAARPGHLVAVDAEEVVILLVVLQGRGAGLLPLGGVALLGLQQVAQIVVAGGGGGGGGVEVVGVVGDDQEIHVVHAVGVLIGVLQGADAVGVLGGVGVDLAEVQGLAALADEEVPVLGDGLAVGAGDRDGDGMLAVLHIRLRGIGELVTGDRCGDCLAVQLHRKGGVLPDVGEGDRDLGPLVVAGGGVGGRGIGQDQGLVPDLEGLLVGIGLAQLVLDLDEDRDRRGALEISRGDGEAAFADRHGRLHMDPVGGGLAAHQDHHVGAADPDGIADVVDLEAHRAV